MVDFLSRVSTSQIRENNRINNIRISQHNIVKVNSDPDPTASKMDFSNGANDG